MRIDQTGTEIAYFAETATNYLAAAEKCWNEHRLAKAQELLREARYWAKKVPPEGFTESDFTDNLRVMELKISRGY